MVRVFMLYMSPGAGNDRHEPLQFAAEFSRPISWTSAMDIGGERVGTVSGFINMLGHFGGSVAPAVTGLLLAIGGNAWTVAFYCSALIYAAGALCWKFIDPVTPLDLERRYER
jgi:nitrate/nitrite transporter NarK